MISLSLTAYQLGTMNLYGALIKELRKDNSVNFINSLLFFGIPGLLMNLGVYYLIPILTSRDIPRIVSWTALNWGHNNNEKPGKENTQRRRP